MRAVALNPGGRTAAWLRFSPISHLLCPGKLCTVCDKLQPVRYVRYSTPPPPVVEQPTPATPRARSGVGLRVILFLALVAGSATAGYYATPRQSPRRDQVGLIPDKLVHDFGRLGQSELVQVEFTLTNRYPAPVEIKDVHTSCSCQVPVVSRKHLAPGEQTVIKLTWSTDSKRGRVADPFWVVHTIPGQPERTLGRMTLGVKADVEPDVQVEPTAITFDHGQPGVKRVKLSAGRLATFTVGQVYCNSRSIETTWHPTTSEVEVKYTPRGELDFGPGIQVSVSTDSPREPVLSVPVTIRPQP
jgi:hypothetical protein